MSQMHNYIIKVEFTIFLILLFQPGYPSINSSTERQSLVRKQLEEKGKQGEGKLEHQLQTCCGCYSSKHPEQKPIATTTRED
jgi:hypothetical protein